MKIRNKIYSHLFTDRWLENGLQAFGRGRGVVLMYHEVLPCSTGVPAWTVVDAAEFEKQMTLLQRFFDVISICDAVARVQEGAGREGRPFAVLTFDDGYRGNLTTVLPIMERLRLPFTVYIASKAVEEGTVFWYDKIISLLLSRISISVALPELSPKPFILNSKASEATRWKQMQALLTALKSLSPEQREACVSRILSKYQPSEYGLAMLSPEGLIRLSRSSLVTVGGHTHGHELLDQLADEQVIATLERNRRFLENAVQQEVNDFAYPNGNYDRRIRDLVRKEGWSTAVTTQSGIWDRTFDLFEIPRLPIGRFDSLASFRARLAGNL